MEDPIFLRLGKGLHLTRVTRDSNMDTDKIMALRCPVVCVDFGKGRKPEYPEKIPRSTGEINYRNFTDVKYHTRLGFSGERYNALTACATRASLRDQDLTVVAIEVFLKYCINLFAH